MPFLVYETKATPEGHRRFHNPKRTTKIPRTIREYISDLDPDPDGSLRWGLTEEELLDRLGVESDTYSLVVDLKPGQKGKVSLYRVAGVWGFSGSGWTPLLVLLDALYVDHPVRSVAAFKKSFSTDQARHDKVHEFLYLQFDHRTGARTSWGRSGWVNAALLWPGALRYFQGVIKENLAGGDRFADGS